MNLIYVFLADGFEEIEAVSVIDILRRASLNVKTVGVENRLITGAHGIKVESDISCDDINLEKVEAIVLPGGMPGTTNLANSSVVINTIDYCINNNKLIAAICAAPSILGKQRFLKGKKAVCYPGFEEQLLGAVLDKSPICLCQNILTAKGPGVAIQFALKIVSLLTGDPLANSIKEELHMM